MRVLKEPEVPCYHKQHRCQRCGAMLEVELGDLYAVFGPRDPGGQRRFHAYRFDCGHCGAAQAASLPVDVARYVDVHAVRHLD